MKKQKIIVSIGIILIICIIISFIYKKVQKVPSVENLIDSKEWENKEENLKVSYIHTWEISAQGEIKCNHCQQTYKINEKIDYTPDSSKEQIKLTKELTGYREEQIISKEDAEWIVLGITEDGKGLLITTEKPLNRENGIIFQGAQEYNNGIDILNTICRELYSNSQKGIARSMTLEDVNTYLNITNLSTQYILTEMTVGEDGGSTTVEKWETIDNLITKVKEIPIYKKIIEKGTYTPDGQNTAEALGEYYINGYVLQTSGEDKIENGECEIGIFGTGKYIKVKAEKQFFIFGTYMDFFSYWLASTGVSVSSDFVAFGLSTINNRCSFFVYGNV